MRKSLIPVTYDPVTGVNLDPGTRVMFTPGPNPHGIHPEAELIGVYESYRVMDNATHIRIMRGGERFSPTIGRVSRVWDARDEEIERLREQVAVLQVTAPAPSAKVVGKDSTAPDVLDAKSWKPGYMRKEHL